MKMKEKFNQSVLAIVMILSIVSIMSLAAQIKNQKAQKDEPQIKSQKDLLECVDHKNNPNIVSQCEIREQTLPATRETVTIDGIENGEIIVKGWDRNEILLRSRVKAGAKTESDALEIIKQVKIETGGMKIRAVAAPSVQNADWHVSYEIFVPRQTDLSLRASYGGVSVSGVDGHTDFNVSYGGVTLNGVGGKVTGQVTYSGLYIYLTGNRWEGEGMDITTSYGGNYLYLPENYSAHLIVGSENGPLKIKVPLNAENIDQNDKILSANLGGGGATVRLASTNGAVFIGQNP